MDTNTSMAAYNTSYVASYSSSNSGLNFLANNPYSPNYRLENQPMYKMGAFLRASFDGMVSNASNVIGHLSEKISYSLNSVISAYQNNNNVPPIIETSGLTSNITSVNLKDDDFSLFVQNLNAQFKPQHKLENERISVKAACINATYTNFFLKDFEPNASITALSGLLPINLTEAINMHAPLLLNQISDLKLKQIKNKDIVAYNTIVKFQETNGVDTILINAVQFSYNPENPDLVFSEAGTTFENQLNADKNLSPEILDYFSTKLFEQYPFIQTDNPCKNLSSTTQNSINDIILSRTYSAHAETTEDQLNQALGTYSKFSYSTDIIRALSASIAGGDKFSAVPSDSHYTLNGASYAVHREEPLKIVHCQNTEEMTQHSEDKETVAVNRRGYYSPEFNVITFKGEKGDKTENIFVPAFIHESSHAVINRLFKNDCKPFFKTDESQKAYYAQAEIAVFKNVAQKLMLGESELLTLNTTENIIEAIKQSNLLNELITEEDNVIAKGLNISEEEFLILSELHSLIYHYPPNTISTELIVRIPQLLTQGVPTITLENYFKPLMNYWENIITPEVTKIVEIARPTLYLT